MGRFTACKPNVYTDWSAAAATRRRCAPAPWRVLIWLAFSAAWLLAGCQSAPPAALSETTVAPALETATSESPAQDAAPSASPTRPAPSPTVITPAPSRTASPSPTRPGPSTTPSQTPRPTRTPTNTPTPAILDGAVQFRSPGPMSRLVSPIQLRVSIKPGPDGRVRIELFGEDGRLLVRKIQRYAAGVSRALLEDSLEFELPGAAETGRLQVSTYDEHGRIVSLAAQDVLLLAMGKAEINPPGLLTEPILILEPPPNKLIQGGRLLVSGLARSPSNLPFLIELITADGKVVGYRQGSPGDAVQVNGYAPYLVDVPYQVDKPTWVRLTVKVYSDSRISGIIYVTSAEILLSP